MHCSFWVPLKPVQVHWCFLLVNWRSLGTTTQPPFWKKYSTVCISNWKIKNSLKKYIWPPSFKYLHITHESQQENCSRHGLFQPTVSTLTRELNQPRYVSLLRSELISLSLMSFSTLIWVYFSLWCLSSLSLFCHCDRLIVQCVLCVWVYCIHFKKSSFVIMIESWFLNLIKEMVK